MVLVQRRVDCRGYEICLNIYFIDVECEWLQSTANDRRKKFCSKYEGYDELCNCANPFPLTSISPVVSCVSTPSLLLYLFPCFYL